MALPVPELDLEWVQLVEPTLPKMPPAGSIPIELVRKLMGKLDAAKVRSLNESMPDLAKGLDISNIMVAMRDGVELEMRIFKPENIASVPVYLGYHFLMMFDIELLTRLWEQVSRRRLVCRQQ
jgi:hypothetical protein